MSRWLTGIFCLLVGASSWAQVNEVGFDISTDSSLTIQSGFSAASGQSLVINIVGNNWTTATAGGGLDLSFNNTLLSLQSTVIDTANFDIPYGTCDNTGGFAACSTPGSSTSGSISQIDFGQFFASPQAGNFEIATLTFTVIGKGTDATGLNLSADTGNPFVDGAYPPNTLPVNFESASVTVPSSVVAPVPEPPTLVLIAAAGILGFFLYRRSATA